MKNFLLLLIGLIIGFAICALIGKCNRNTGGSQPQTYNFDSTKLPKFKTFAVKVPPDKLKEFMIDMVNNDSSKIFLGIKVSKQDLLYKIDSVTRNSGSDSIRMVIGGVGELGNLHQALILQSGSDDKTAISTCPCPMPCCPVTKAPFYEGTLPTNGDTTKTDSVRGK